MGKILFPSFPRELEAEFSRSYNRDAATVARVALMLGGIVFLSFVVVTGIGGMVRVGAGSLAARMNFSSRSLFIASIDA